MIDNQELVKATEFTNKFSKELSDPVLHKLIVGLIESENSKGRYIDQEEALYRAKQLMEEHENSSNRE